MRLKRVIITGFKSFRDKSVIEFGEGITAIVGPNGCGKSNVLDAIRWAFGSGSAKSLRTGKMPDVLFSGTEKSKGKGIAEVKILFEAEGDPLQIGSSEIEIGRKLSSDGLSDYYVNDKNVRLKDLQLLLHQMGLGKEGFWCFEQGKVDQVITWSPEERRSVFEETSGISLYLSQKREALEKLEETKSKLQILLEREREAEKLLGFLKTQAIETEKYLKIKERSHKVERELYGARLFHIQESIKYEEVRHHTLLGERLELQEQEKRLKLEGAPLEKEAENCLQDKQRAEEELLHLHHSIENRKRELEQLNGKIRSIESIVQDRKHRIEREEKTKFQIEKEIDALKAESNRSTIETLKQKLDAAFLLREEKESELEKLLQIERKEEEERLEGLKKSHAIEQKLSQIHQLRKIRDEIVHLESLAWPDLEEKQEQLKQLERSIRQLSEESATCSGRLRSIDEMIKKLPGSLPGNLKIQELYPEKAAPLLKKFPLKKGTIEKGSALLGPYFNAIAIENPSDLSALLKQLEGLSFSLYVGLDPEYSLKDWVISPKKNFHKEGDQVVPLRGIQWLMADTMIKSHAEVPQFTYVIAHDPTPLRKARSTQKGVTLTAYFMKAWALVAKEFPLLNASVDAEKKEIYIHPSVDLGIAVDTKEGLLLPVIKGVDKLPFSDLVKEFDMIKEGARSGTLAPESMRGGTLSISNFGTLGGVLGTPLIPYGQTAILGIGKMEEVPVVHKGQIEIGYKQYLSLSCDHRIIDGGMAARAAEKLVALLKIPEQWT